MAMRQPNKQFTFFLVLCAVMTTALFAQTGAEDLAVFNRMMKYKMDGFYTLEFSKQGYIKARMEFEVKLNNVFNGRFSMSPVMRGDYLRIVLDWGRQPADLDLHLVKEGSYHISYWDMHKATDGSVTLDLDARNGFGPETITIMETDLGAVYQVYVHDYTNRNRNTSTELARSGAAVRVFDRYGHVRSFFIPANLPGVKWNVFRIVNGEIRGY